LWGIGKESLMHQDKTDWLLMSKLEEKNAEGGETVMLHLDDWEHCKELSNDLIGKQNFGN